MLADDCRSNIICAHLRNLRIEKTMSPEELLRRYFDFSAFRPGQKRVMSALWRRKAAPGQERRRVVRGLEVLAERGLVELKAGGYASIIPACGWRRMPTN